MIHRHRLEHPGGSTRILIGAGALAAAAEELAPWLAGRTAFVLSTPHVRQLHGAALAALEPLASRVVPLEVVDGEAAKSLAHAERLWQEMLAAGGKRDSVLLAAGGGSACDLGGFVAGCFLRGIEVAQLPTTLLAQVDAALGGKTAVDLPGGKNTVGLFHHPAWVVADTRVLATLPRGELRSGLVEVVKMAALLDPELLARVEADVEALLGGDPEALAPVVAAAAVAKCGVVERDPAEGDYRKILNFGHTLGHAIEGVLAYRDLRHGEAVAYGMLFALRLAGRHGGVSDELDRRLRRLLRRLEMPPLPALSAAALGEFFSRDKKATEGGLTWVLPRALGRGEMVSDIAPGDVLDELAAFLADPWGGLGYTSN